MDEWAKRAVSSALNIANTIIDCECDPDSNQTDYIGFKQNFLNQGWLRWCLKLLEPFEIVRLPKFYYLLNGI